MDTMKSILASLIEKKTYFLLMLTASIMAVLGYTLILPELGIIKDDYYAMAEVFGLILGLPGFVISIVTLIATLRGLILGPNRLRVRIILWYGCLTAILIPIDRVSNQAAAFIALMGLPVLVGFSVLWYVGVKRTGSEEATEALAGTQNPA
jgi:hypothetical protein